MLLERKKVKYMANSFNSMNEPLLSTFRKVPRKFGNNPMIKGSHIFQVPCPFTDFTNNVCVKKTETNWSSDTLLQFALVFFDSDVI